MGSKTGSGFSARCLVWNLSHSLQSTDLLLAFYYHYMRPPVDGRVMHSLSLSIRLSVCLTIKASSWKRLYVESSHLAIYFICNAMKYNTILILRCHFLSRSQDELLDAKFSIKFVLFFMFFSVNWAKWYGKLSITHETLETCRQLHYSRWMQCC